MAGTLETVKGQYEETHIPNISTEALVMELSRRGGHPGALADAILLGIRKSKDYNHGQSTNPHLVDRTRYFPFGELSYAQMIYTKAERFVALTRKQISGEDPNFEGLRDTALDIINYAGFFLADKRFYDEELGDGPVA